MLKKILTTEEIVDIHQRLTFLLENKLPMELPLMFGVIRLMRLYLDYRVETAAVLADGTVLFNPLFAGDLNDNQIIFVLAHELYHLMWQTHDRMTESDSPEIVNIASDLLINEMLISQFHEYPQGILLWKELFQQTNNWRNRRNVLEFSLEELVAILSKVSGLHKLSSWNNNAKWYKWRQEQQEETSKWKGNDTAIGNTLQIPDQFFSDKMQEAQNAEIPDGIFTSEAGKRRLKPKDKDNPFARFGGLDVFFDESPDELVSALDGGEEGVWHETFVTHVEQIQKSLEDFFTLQVLQETFFVTEASPSDSNSQIEEISPKKKSPWELLRQQYETPWEDAIQAWHDSVFTAKRSFARASRRGAWRTDVILPGKQLENNILTVIFDTSPDFSERLPETLGALEDFCLANQLDVIRVIQCRNSAIAADEIIDTAYLAEIDIRGEEPPEPPESPEPPEPPEPPEQIGTPNIPEKPATPEVTLPSPMSSTQRRKRRRVVSYSGKKGYRSYSRSYHRHRYKRKNRASMPWGKIKSNKPAEPKQLHIEIELPESPREPSKEEDFNFPFDDNLFLNDLSPAFDRLSEEGGTEAVLVITNGNVKYPIEEPEYSVLWAVLSPVTHEFDWGTVVKFKPKKSN